MRRVLLDLWPEFLYKAFKCEIGDLGHESSIPSQVFPAMRLGILELSQEARIFNFLEDLYVAIALCQELVFNP